VDIREISFSKCIWTLSAYNYYSGLDQSTGRLGLFRHVSPPDLRRCKWLTARGPTPARSFTPSTRTRRPALLSTSRRARRIWWEIFLIPIGHRALVLVVSNFILPNFGKFWNKSGVTCWNLEKYAFRAAEGDLWWPPVWLGKGIG